MLKKIWHPLCSSTKKWLTQQHDHLRKEIARTRLLRIIGGSVGLTGTVVSIIGFALLPVTLGFSLGLTVGGALVAICGGAVSSTGSIYKIGLVYSKSKQIRKEIALDAQLSCMMQNKLVRLEQVFEQCSQVPVPIPIRGTTIRLALQSIQAMVRLGTVTGKVVVLFGEVGLTGGVLAARLTLSTARVSVAAVRAIPIVGIVLSAATAPIDIFDIGHACYHLRRGKESRIVQWIQEQVDCLGEKMNTVLRDYEEEQHSKHLASPGDSDKEECNNEQNDESKLCEHHKEQPCRDIELCEYDEEPRNRYSPTT